MMSRERLDDQNSSQANTDQSIFSWGMTINVKRHALEARVSCRWPEVGRHYVWAPMVAAFKAVCEARHEEARVKGVVTDQQLILIVCVCYSSSNK